MLYLTNTIFAFLSLNSASWAREEIFGSKFLSFGRAGVIVLIVSVLCAVMSVSVQKSMSEKSSISFRMYYFCFPLGLQLQCNLATVDLQM